MPIHTSKGFQIAFEKVQPCGPRHLLLIHGNLASKEWWFPALECLQEEDGEGVAIAADWRGFGGSKGIQRVDEIDFTRFAQDLVDLVVTQGLQEVSIIGHSTGGLIAMLAVLQRPDLFSSMVLLDSVGPQGLQLAHPKEQVLAHFDRMARDLDYCRQVLAATIQGCDPQSASFERLLQITRSCDPVMWRGVIEVLSSQIDIRDRLGELTLPTLILHGQNDVVLPLSTSEALHRDLPNSRLRVMGNQGHSLNLENPSLFVSECRQFWSHLS